MIIHTFMATAMLAVSLGSAAGAQGNGNVPRSTYITTMDQEYGKMDADKNGQISPTEFMKLVTGTPPADGRHLLAKLDLNKDGAISLIEHRAGKLSYFDQIDTDKDGVVTVAEMKAAGVVQ